MWFDKSFELSKSLPKGFSMASRVHPLLFVQFISLFDQAANALEQSIQTYFSAIATVRMLLVTLA